MDQGSVAAAVTARGVENPLDLDQTLDALETGVFVLDGAHRVVAWNAWIGRVSAVDRNLAVGRTIEELFSIATKTRLSRAVELALTNGVASFLSRFLQPRSVATSGPRNRPRGQTEHRGASGGR